MSLFLPRKTRPTELSRPTHLQGVYCSQTRRGKAPQQAYEGTFYGSKAQDSRLDFNWCDGGRPHHSATASRRARWLDTVATGRTAATRRRVRHGQDRLRRADRREETDHRRHLGNGLQPGSALGLFRQEILQGISRRHLGPLCRCRH